MDRSLRICSLLASSTLAVAVGSMCVQEADAQLLGRRILRQDYKAMEEYYDDLEDYYEDRNPRLAREAERMENYFEDLRKGRATGPPPVLLPGVRSIIDPRFRPAAHEEPRQAVPPRQPGQPQPAAQPRSRWQPWGESATPAPAAAPSPTMAPEPTLALAAVPPAEPTPPQAPPVEPTPPSMPELAPEPTEVRRAPVDEATESSVLRFSSPKADRSPASPLKQAHARLVQSLEQLAAKNPSAAAMWTDHLAVPVSDSPDLAAGDFYTTAEGRAQLTATVERYDRVASDPQFRAIARLAGFSDTRSQLRQVLASLEQQPTLAEPEEAAPEAEVLPLPPAE